MSDDNAFNAKERIKLFDIIASCDETQLRGMLASAQKKARDGITRKAACGYNPEERAAIYTCELIKRGAQL